MAEFKNACHKVAGFCTWSDLTYAGQVKWAFVQVLDQRVGTPLECGQCKWTESYGKIIAVEYTNIQQQLFTLAAQIHGASVEIMREKKLEIFKA